MKTGDLGKCLSHWLQLPSGVRRQFILPYQGNLTDSKYRELAGRLLWALKDDFPSATRLDYMARLRHPMLTGKEKFVHIERDSYGKFTLKGEGWMSFGADEGDFTVLDGTACVPA